MTENKVTVFKRPNSERPVPTVTCPGCGHPITWRLLAEVVDDLNIRDRTISVSGIGCHDFFRIGGLFDFDQLRALHGRAPAVASGVKRTLPPDRIVFTIQGDGDMMGEGCSEIIHAAARGERITAILCNNAGLSETGGDLCPSTLIGQRTKTSPYGRDVEIHGYPLQLAEMLAGMPGVVYVARGAISSPPNVIELKKMIRRAFELQMSGKGLTFVEILSPCPSGWGLSPMEALKFVTEKLMAVNPLGELKTPSGNETKAKV